MSGSIVLFALALLALMFVASWIVIAVLCAFWLWMIIDAAKNDRVWWLVLIIGLPVVGFLIYYLTHKRFDSIPPHTDHYGRKIKKVATRTRGASK